MQKYLLIILAIFVIACKPTTQNGKASIAIQDLPSSTAVKKSGELLISQPNGLTQIEGQSTQNDSILIITVHGYKSEGYEWIEALNKFTDKYSKVYFYRYDWNKCPDVVGKSLAKSIDSLLVIDYHINKIKIYGHSYGGLVVTYCAGNLNTTIPTEINTIAAPLAGYPRILDNCTTLYNEQHTINYPDLESNVSIHQWRTQKDQDGAYRDLDFNPQDVEIENSIVTVLPDSIDGHRLGHNWSVTWVINHIREHE